MRCAVVVPCHNEEPTLRDLHRGLTAALSASGADYQVLLIDDGSTDGTLAAMRRLAAEDGHVRYVALSRRFGQEAAMAAGLDRADADAVILMDADLQDPPELIPQLVAKWREGFEAVHVTWRGRAGVSLARRWLTRLAYRIIRRLSEVPIPLETANFRLLDRRVVEALRQCREPGRSVRGLVPWLGFRQAAVVMAERPARSAGRSKYGLRNLARLGLNLVGLSVRPLRMAGHLAFYSAVAAFGLAAVAVVRGWAAGAAADRPLFVAGLFVLMGVQVFLTGVVGGYVARLVVQGRARPLYIVREEGSGEAAPTGPDAASPTKT